MPESTTETRWAARAQCDRNDVHVVRKVHESVKLTYHATNFKAWRNIVMSYGLLMLAWRDLSYSEPACYRSILSSYEY